MRKQGATYSVICSALGVTKERCIAYLKDIKPDCSIESAMSCEWQNAEKEAKDILIGLGFCDLHDLNAICSFPPSWDILAKKGDTNQWWLIDVTINGQKSIAAKRDVVSEGYEHAILLKTQNEWKLIRIAMDVINTIQIDEK